MAARIQLIHFEGPDELIALNELAKKAGTVVRVLRQPPKVNELLGAQRMPFD